MKSLQGSLLLKIAVVILVSCLANPVKANGFLAGSVLELNTVNQYPSVDILREQKYKAFRVYWALSDFSNSVRIPFLKSILRIPANMVCNYAQILEKRCWQKKVYDREKAK